MTVLEKIKKEKERRGLDASELARMAGLNYWPVVHTLNGRSAKQEVVDRLARALGIEAKN